MDQNFYEPRKINWTNRWWGIVFLLVLAALILVPAVIIYNFVDYLQSSPAASAQNPQPNSALIESVGEPFMGASQPKITIVEFGDYQCPFCLQEYPIIKKVAETYSQDVKFIFRDFPLTSIHANALLAALAANCANEQGKFWAYHDLLYDNQSDLSATNLKALAQQAGLDQNKFNDCVNSQKYLSKVQNDLNDGISLGLSGTPTFFINGIKAQGVIDYDTWVSIIEEYKALNSK